MTPILEAENLVKKYGENVAVKGISFTMEEGEVFGLLGPNGAGKSTTISMLTCLFPPTEGRIRIYGHDVVKEAGQVKRLIGIVPQDLALYPTLNARDNLTFYGQMFGLGGADLRGLDDLALPPVFRKNGTVHAGNSSGITDGAASVMVLSEKALARTGIRPSARIVGHASAGVDPAIARPVAPPPTPAAIGRGLAEERVRTAEVWLDAVSKAVGATPIPGVDETADQLEAVARANAEFWDQRHETREKFLASVKSYFGETVRGWFSGFMKTMNWLTGNPEGAEKDRLDQIVHNVEDLQSQGLLWLPLMPKKYMERQMMSALMAQTGSILDAYRNMPAETRAAMQRFVGDVAKTSTTPEGRQLCRTALYAIVDSSAVGYYGAPRPARRPLRPLHLPGLGGCRRAGPRRRRGPAGCKCALYIWFYWAGSVDNVDRGGLQEFVHGAGRQ